MSITYEWLLRKRTSPKTSLGVRGKFMLPKRTVLTVIHTRGTICTFHP